MTHRKTLFAWTLFVLTACSKSLWDVLYLRRDGTFDTIFYGRQAFSSHPVWCCVNIILDVGSVLGAAIVTRNAIVSRRRRANG